MPKVSWKRLIAGLLLALVGQKIYVEAATTTDTIVKGVPSLAALFPFSESADKILKEAAEAMTTKKKKKPKAQSKLDKEMGLPPYVDDYDLDEAIENNPAVVAEFTAPEGSGPNVPWKIDMKGLKEEMQALGSKAKLVRVDVMKHQKLAAEMGQSHGPWPTLLMFKGDRRKTEVKLGDNNEIARNILAMEIPSYKKLTKSEQTKFLENAKGVTLVATAALRSSNALAYLNVCEQLLTDPVWTSGYGDELRCGFTKTVLENTADRWHMLQMQVPGQSELVTYSHTTWSESAIKQWALRATFPALWEVTKFDHQKYESAAVTNLGFTASVVLLMSSDDGKDVHKMDTSVAALQAFRKIAQDEKDQGRFAFAAAPLVGLSNVSKVVMAAPLESDRTQITILSRKDGQNQAYVTTDAQHLQTAEGLQTYLSNFLNGKLEPLPPPPSNHDDPKEVLVLDPTVDAIEVTDSNWDSIVGDHKKDVFVMFTAPGEECTLCEQLKPKWKELAQRVHQRGWDKTGLVIAYLDGKAHPNRIPKSTANAEFTDFPHFSLYAQTKNSKKQKKPMHFGNSKSAERMVKDPNLQRTFEDVLMEQAESVKSQLMKLEL